MEIKAELNKPYTEEERIDFIVEQNHKNGYEIREDKNSLQAWGLTESEIAQKEAERIARLHLRRGDVFRGLLHAKGVTKTQLKAMIEAMPDGIEKEEARIDFDDALEFYRGVALVDTIGTALGITSNQMTEFFETNDYQKLNT
jgi:hypothetical protein